MNVLPEPFGCWDRQDYEWGFRDGMNNAPWPEFLPPPSYYEGRRAGANARRQAQRDAA